MSVAFLLQTYAQRIRELRRANADVPETALAPAFQQLLHGLIPPLRIAQGLSVSPEFLNPGVGRPDIALKRTGSPPRAFVELKAPSKSADPTRWRGADAHQFERFKEFPCWATSNFTEIRLFYRDEESDSATVVPESSLRPDRDDARADKAVSEHDPAPLLRLLERLFEAAGQEPSARDAPHLAELMAHSARLVRGIVRDRLAELHREENPGHALLQVRREFRDVLYAHPEAGGYSTGDFDELFSAAFAQTLAFGLLLVREGIGLPVGVASWERMPEEHPLMRTALRVLSQPEVVRDVGIGFEVICDTVDSFAPEILAVSESGRDPILYFYEDFLRTFDPAAREKYGVYYTPVEVVRYIVAALDRTARDNLGLDGLRDPNLTILDPATGTGTFLLGIAERVRTQTEVEAGAGMAALALQQLAGRMFGFELLVGPYAVAHYRLHHALRRPHGGTPLTLPRLGVYLADTLAEPGAASAAGSLGFVAQGIADERREANRIKTRQPILAIIGNPPYRRLREGENRTLVGDWLDGVWDDLKKPVSDAGWGRQLRTFPELSVAFWRWAIWKLFEAENAPRRGIVAFITNRKFLTGSPYAGLRKMMRDRFDRIEIIDLRGDLRRGGRSGVDGEQGVFDIQVGTAITLAIACGTKAEGEAAEVYYQDTWTDGLFSRRAKFDWLTERAVTGTSPNPVAVNRGLLDDMRPEPFQNGEWLNLRAAFILAGLGVKTGNDDVFVSTLRSGLRQQIEPLLSGRADSRYDQSLETFYCYRPLDRRWFFNDPRLLDRPRRNMQRAWASDNLCLYAMPNGTNAGPAVWCHALLPDYHALRGNYGGYALLLYDRRPQVNAANLSAALVESLGTAYGEPVAAEDVFDAILCLLSATSYTRRFAEDLEDVFPHVPCPAQFRVFCDAVRIGREIRLVETFTREPRAAYRLPSFARVETQPRGVVSTVDYADGAIILCADGSGRVTGIPQQVWDFSVSRYPVLPRWIEGRRALPADFALVGELRDICGRIAELIDLFREADIVLEATLGHTLTREALGFAAGAPDEDVGPN
jgi:Type ISP C-terminal specificity domain/N-6 DNA Methylase